MKAIVQDRYGGPECLRLDDIPVPEPSKHQVRLKVLACAVNLSDWEYLIGSPFYARMAGGLIRPKYQVLGSDIVGVVEKLGSEAADFSVGDRVMGDFVMVRGGFAQFACVSVADLAKVPDGLADEVAACLPQAGGIALAGTEGLNKGDTLLINGAGGGSGTMAIQLAKTKGAHITAVDNSSKVDWLKSLGADTVIDYQARDFASSDQQWDRILDMVATRGPSKISRALNPNGIYKALGGNVPILLSLVFGGLPFRFQKKSIGMLLVPTGRETTKRLARMALEGKITPHIEAVLTLASVPEALRRTGLGEVKGKLVIKL